MYARNLPLELSCLSIVGLAGARAPTSERSNLESRRLIQAYSPESPTTAVGRHPRSILFSDSKVQVELVTSYTQANQSIKVLITIDGCRKVPNKEKLGSEALRFGQDSARLQPPPQTAGACAFIYCSLQADAIASSITASKDFILCLLLWVKLSIGKSRQYEQCKVRGELRRDHTSR